MTVTPCAKPPCAAQGFRGKAGGRPRADAPGEAGTGRSQAPPARRRPHGSLPLSFRSARQTGRRATISRLHDGASLGFRAGEVGAHPELAEPCGRGLEGAPCPVRPARPGEQARQAQLAARAQRPHAERVAQRAGLRVGRLGVVSRRRFSPGRDLGPEPQRPRLVSPLVLPANESEGPSRGFGRLRQAVREQYTSAWRRSTWE